MFGSQREGQAKRVPRAVLVQRAPRQRHITFRAARQIRNMRGIIARIVRQTDKSAGSATTVAIEVVVYFFGEAARAQRVLEVVISIKALGMSLIGVYGNTWLYENIGIITSCRNAVVGFSIGTIWIVSCVSQHRRLIVDLQRSASGQDGIILIIAATTSDGITPMRLVAVFAAFGRHASSGDEHVSTTAVINGAVLSSSMGSALGCLNR